MASLLLCSCTDPQIYASKLGAALGTATCTSDEAELPLCSWLCVCPAGGRPGSDATMKLEVGSAACASDEAELHRPADDTVTKSDGTCWRSPPVMSAALRRRPGNALGGASTIAPPLVPEMLSCRSASCCSHDARRRGLGLPALSTPSPTPLAAFTTRRAPRGRARGRGIFPSSSTS